MNPQVILCTGGIGSGKSVVVKAFNLLGVPSYDCDRAAKELYDRDPQLLAGVVALAGAAVLPVFSDLLQAPVVSTAEQHSSNNKCFSKFITSICFK